MTPRLSLAQCGKVFDTLEKPVRRDGYIAADDVTAWREAADVLRLLCVESYGRVATNASLDDFKAFAKDRFIIGGPETFIRELKGYEFALQTDLIILRVEQPGIPADKVLNAVRLLGEHVLPALSG